MPRVVVQQQQFRFSQSGEVFRPWGFNYDHDQDGKLIEDYWHNDWERVTEDFQEMKELGANLVRVHLQIGKFLISPNDPNPKQLARLKQLCELATSQHLYLDITGLACYHKQDTPDWYKNLDETERWQAQGVFWKAVAATCHDFPCVFCYDLMNEPILPGQGEQAVEWLTGDFGGKQFVQRISLNLGQRSRLQVAEDWIVGLKKQIRSEDSHTLITVGVIPWAQTFPGADPIFYSPQCAQHLDFVSIHLYPRQDELERTISALEKFEIGKPILIEETFPLYSGQDQFRAFYEQTQKRVAGFVGFYWGTTLEEYAENNDTISSTIMHQWLQFFREQATVQH